MTETHLHDIVIAGGGMAGSALAIGLAGLGFDVAVVEAVARGADHQPSHDDRTLVVNRASGHILKNLGVLDDRLAHCPIRTIEVGRAGGFGHVTLRAAEHGLERFGQVIVARELGNRLIEGLAEAGISQYCPDRVETLTADDEAVAIRLGSGTRLSARLLVAADGTGSTVRQAAGIASTLHDYRQSAMIFNVLAEPRSSDIAIERFTDVGPLAFLPQPEGRYGVVFVEATERIDQAMAWSDDELIERLQRRAGPVLSGFSRPGRRVAYPLKLLTTRVPISRRVVAIGNAANTVHPVSAQGLNLGLRDIAHLIEALEAANDPGAPAWLARYLAARRDDHRQTVRYTDTLARAFSNPSLPFRIGTRLGITAHALLPGLRRQLVTAAMGYREPVARLARESAA